MSMSGGVGGWYDKDFAEKDTYFAETLVATEESEPGGDGADGAEHEAAEEQDARDGAAVLGAIEDPANDAILDDLRPRKD